MNAFGNPGHDDSLFPRYSESLWSFRRPGQVEVRLGVANFIPPGPRLCSPPGPSRTLANMHAFRTSWPRPASLAGKGPEYTRNRRLPSRGPPPRRPRRVRVLVPGPDLFPLPVTVSDAVGDPNADPNLDLRTRTRNRHGCVNRVGVSRAPAGRGRSRAPRVTFTLAIDLTALRPKAGRPRSSPARPRLRLRTRAAHPPRAASGCRAGRPPARRCGRRHLTRAPT